jgi:L-lysine 6-transaminase
VDEVEENVFKKSSRINSTWGGNLVDMVRFGKFLQVIEQENLVENARQVGGYLIECLTALANDYPQIISNVRGRGLMCAIDFPSTEMRDSFRNSCYEHGLIILGCGDHSIRFRPALNLTKAVLDEGFMIIRSVIEELAHPVILDPVEMDHGTAKVE